LGLGYLEAREFLGPQKHILQIIKQTEGYSHVKINWIIQLIGGRRGWLKRKKAFFRKSNPGRLFDFS
jgi:hypothetical protein